MYFHDGIDNPARASALLRQLIDDHDPKYGVGSMSCSIYDTAWVAMIAKTIEGQTRYLFPSSFEFLLETQDHDGGWSGRSFSSEVDCVLNSLAALLALSRHIARPYQAEEATEDLKQRKTRAIYFLDTKFTQWNVTTTASHPGFQPLIAKLLQMLENEGVNFGFPGRELFLHTKSNKKAAYSPAALYGDARTPAIHSLEGRIGEIDFDRLSQHKISGSMMASPASTAAYLMNCSVWDDEAEAYLSHIVSHGNGSTLGGVPSRFPTTVFELSGAILILLENGFCKQDVDSRILECAADFLHDCLALESGVAGFAPYVEPDADNTARAISALSLLGRSQSLQGLIVRYGTRNSFKTHTQDRNPTFRTNCHVLKTLLDALPRNEEQLPQINKVVTFLCNCWWTTNGRIEDQSNRSPNYPIMLMTDAFIRLIECWKWGVLPVPDDSMVQDKVTISLFEALIRVLQTQNLDGSWGSGGCETTSYAIIALARLSSLSAAPRIRQQVIYAIGHGRSYLTKTFRTFAEPDHIWTGKTTSGSSVLYQAYVLAAMQASISKQQTGPTIESHFEISLAKLTIQTKYYARQPWFANVPESLIQACLVECRLFLPQLEDVRYAVFSSDLLQADKHFEAIPFTWIAASNLDKRAIGAEFLLQMMILSVLNRQFEDYMQNVVDVIFTGCMFEVEDIVHSIFQELDMHNKDQCFCDAHSSWRSSTATTISNVRSVLYRFISHILNHPYVLMASERDQDQLKKGLLAFVLTRVRQLHIKGAVASPSDQTPHSYTFAFLCCIFGHQSSNGGVGLRRDFWSTPEQQYLAADLCRHMSVISLMSITAHQAGAEGSEPGNSHSRTMSFGSDGQSSSAYAFSRSVSTASSASSTYTSDQASPISPISSVSSIPSDSPRNSFFPKLSSALEPSSSTAALLQEPLQMTRLLDHERKSVKICLESLGETGINDRTANILKLFVDVTELSEQIYSDPNIGSSCGPTTASDVIEQLYILQPPPVPPKKTRGSVAAARAALTIPPLATKQTSYQTPRVKQLAGEARSSPIISTPATNSIPPPPVNVQRSRTRPASPQRPTHSKRSLTRLPSPESSSPLLQPTITNLASSPPVPQIQPQTARSTSPSSASISPTFASANNGTLTPGLEERCLSPLPMERDWSWNKRSNLSPHRPLRSFSSSDTQPISEVTRIERILKDIDEVRISSRTPKSDHQRRNTSHSDPVCSAPKPKIDAHRRLSSASPTDAEAIKLAKTRMQMQRRAEHEARRKTAVELPSRATLEASSVSMRPVKETRVESGNGGWVRAPPPSVSEMPMAWEMQARKLHKASRLGGPRWKAPF